MKFDVLDKGFVELVDHMGDDQRIVDMARQSFNAPGAKISSTTEELIRYLMRSQHSGPFEHCVVSLQVKCPFFVARQWHRHRTQSYSEVSARYVELPDEVYIPKLERLRGQSKTNKQGSGEALNEADALLVIDELERASKDAFDSYATLLGNNDANISIARELARMVLPMNTYTTYSATANLWNWMRFLHLRLSDHAQDEVRDYARAILAILETKYPIAMRAFHDYIVGAVTFSAQELNLLRMLVRDGVDNNDLDLLMGSVGLSKREKQEFRGKLDL